MKGQSDWTVEVDNEKTCCISRGGEGEAAYSLVSIDVFSYSSENSSNLSSVFEVAGVEKLSALCSAVSSSFSVNQG